MKKNNGFTLIETLMVIFLMGIILVGGGGLFFNIMKGASKAEVEKEVKQNGDYAMAIMERMIRNSSAVIDCTSFNSLTIKNIDNRQTIFREDGGKIASSGAGLLYLTSNQVTVSSPLTFTYYPACSSPDAVRRIDIDFSLTGGSTQALESYAKIDFHTSVSLRNFEK
jgi:prepilin-type N-terminal cleavage/methylation domain-containing protein